MKELELEERNRKGRIIIIALWIVVTLFFVLYGVFNLDTDGMTGIWCLLIGILIAEFGGIGIFSKKNRRKRYKTTPNGVEITELMASFGDKKFNASKQLFELAGFTNVNCVGLGDLNVFSLMLNGLVNSISIDGYDHIQAGDVYPRDAVVVITYHSIR